MQYHLDPSIIIQTPILNGVLVKLGTHSLGFNLISLLANHLFAHQKRSSIVSIVASIASGSIFIYVMFLLCGFHPTYFPVQTILASIYVALNTICATSLPDEGANSIKENQTANVLTVGQMHIWIYLFGPSQSDVQTLHQFTFYGSFIGMGSTSILRILDHGMQVQRHPMPLLLGFSWGRVGGLCLAGLWGLIRKKFG